MSEKITINPDTCDASATVKFKFNDMDKSELLQMLAFMQSELEAREIVIATLKSEKCKQLMYQAKYGRLNTALVSSKITSDLSNDNWTVSNTESIFSMYDPFAAMQRDIQYVIAGADQNNDGPSESNLKPVYDSQLNQLENLISSQKKAQIKMKEQIMYLEKKCVKLTQALEDERNKHERDAAQGDDVLVMLEKERERLKSELEYEKSHSRKLERELKRMMAVMEDQKHVIHNQRLAASVIIKAKNQIETDLKAVNMMINKTVNVGDSVTSDTSTKHNHELTDNLSNCQTIQSSNCQTVHQCSHKSNSDRSHESIERHKENVNHKTTKHNSHEIQPMSKHSIKYSQSKDLVPCASVQSPEPVVTQSHQVTIPMQKSRTGKQPESLLWKTYDPKNGLPSSTHSCPISMTSKSPSNIRRQLPYVSTSNSVPISVPSSSFSSSSSLSASRQNDCNYYKHSSPVSSIVTTTSQAITPYQKILSTPPPNSIMNQATSFQSTLSSYGLFNICSPAMQTFSNYPSMKATISSAKTELGNCQPIVTGGGPRSRLVASPIVATSSSASSIVNSSSMIRSGDSSPAIPKHVYVNGK